MIKEELVKAAVDELTAAGEKATDSKLSVMTGVHRKDIAKRRESGNTPPRRESIFSRVIATWRNDPRFSGTGGPRILSDVGVSSEFAALVSSISNDVAPYAVLFELERLGAIEKTARGVKLRSKTYLLPRGESEEGYFMLGEDIADLAAVVEQNIHLPKDKRSLHLKTEFNEIPASAAETVRRWILAEGSRTHRRVEKLLARFERLSKRSKEARVRVSYGSYSKIEHENEK